MGTMNMRPFDIFDELSTRFHEEGLSKAERRAIRERAEERRKSELEDEFEEVAEAMPLMLDELREAKVHKHLAKFMFDFYSELKDAGFTEDQAIKITSANFQIDTNV